MGNLGMPELIVILLIALVLFGANRLPEIGRSIGRSIQEFKKGIASITEEPKSHGDNYQEQDARSPAVPRTAGSREVAPGSSTETKTETRQG